MSFYVFRCKICGRWSSKEVRLKLENSVFKCYFCGKSTKIKKKSQYGLALESHGPYNRGIDAANKCKELNRGDPFEIRRCV